MAKLWYQNAVFYALDVDSFQDSNADGVGDLAGLCDRLDYLASLGITALWLQPIHPSGGGDNDYDVTDHYAVDPAIGSLGDFVRLIDEADARGIRVVIDLVVNHTSSRHPWFTQARSDPASPFREFYIWSDRPDASVEAEPAFPGHQHGVWCFDEAAGAFYLHHFYDFQPDLNIASPAVRDEIFKIVDFWLRLGVSGFRIDAAPFVVKKASWADPREDGHWFLRELSQYMRRRNREAILLAESNVEPDRYANFFAEGEGVQVPLNFYVNQHLWLTKARGDARPLVDALLRMPGTPPSCGYANWLRNHDELDLSRLTEHQRREVYEAFGPQESMQLYDRGIRRRLAPMLDGDQNRIEAAFSLLLSLPGVPVIFYGDELGMGEDLDLPERDSVRTAMQWSPGPGAGFSAAPVEKLARPVISGGPYGCETLNVLDASRRPQSLLHAVERLIRTRRECPEIRPGSWTCETETASVFAIRHTWDSRAVLALTNLSPEPVVVQRRGGVALVDELTSDTPYPAADDRLAEVALGPWGYRWFRAHAVDPSEGAGWKEAS